MEKNSREEAPLPARAVWHDRFHRLRQYVVEPAQGQSVAVAIGGQGWLTVGLKSVEAGPGGPASFVSRTLTGPWNGSLGTTCDLGFRRRRQPRLRRRTRARQEQGPRPPQARR